MAVTIKTIAQQAGVTHSTVSRALRDDPRVRPATTARIRAIADELGYTPSRIGRGLKTQRTHALGLVVSHITDPFLTEVIHGVQDKVLPANYSLFVAATNVDPQRETAIVRSFREQRVDGILICSSRLGGLYRTLIAEQAQPIVLINNQGSGQYAYTVAHDDRRAASACVEYLIGCGHRRIAYLGNERGGSTNADRLAGYHAALQAAGVAARPTDVQHAPTGAADAGAAAIQTWLQQTPAERPTAIFCYNDLLAIGVLRALKQASLHVPGDISLVGFDDIDMAAYLDPPLTTFAQPKHALGYQAAELMLHLLDQAVDGAAPVLLYGNLIVRQSVGPPPSET
jgi:LacI family transcriptional regulator/LacI family repressor for deo operon, udp, cdd, tsx, nupC, and nupG